MTESFSERLRRSVAASGPLVVGIDPSPAVARAWGVASDATGLRTISRALLGACAPFAAAIKIQVAFFERLGSRGYAALEEVLEDAREAGLLVIADVKRGDIGSSNEGYAEAWLDGDSPLAVDAVTASPYLGVGALTPLVERAVRGGRGVFVLARTSNPEGERLQGARTPEGATVAEDVVSQVRAWNAGPAAGAVGVVVGATSAGAGELADLGGAVLVPGVGAQSGTAADVRRVTASAAPNSVAVAVSRAITDLGPDPRRLAAAAQHWRNDLVRTLA